MPAGPVGKKRFTQTDFVFFDNEKHMTTAPAAYLSARKAGQFFCLSGTPRARGQAAGKGVSGSGGAEGAGRSFSGKAQERRSLVLSGKAIDEGHAAAGAKGFPAHPDAGCGLDAFVFALPYAPRHVLHQRRIEP